MKQLSIIMIWLFVCASAGSESLAQRKAVSGVTTENNIECGFGHNVSADGTYKKTSGAKPKFGAN